MDNVDEVHVPDECIAQILEDLFAHFDFTVSENTDLEQEIAVDPEMLGHVFEELVVNRVEQGAYYTPKPVVAYICRERQNYLFSCLPDEKYEAIEEFIDRSDPSVMIENSEAVFQSIGFFSGYATLPVEAELTSTVCSRYLMELRYRLFESGKVLRFEEGLSTKADVIQNNLYGVNLDRIAVNVARLRLWLSLAVEYEEGDPPAMPNLDFKIRGRRPALQRRALK